MRLVAAITSEAWAICVSKLNEPTGSDTILSDKPRSYVVAAATATIISGGYNSSSGTPSVTVDISITPSISKCFITLCSSVYNFVAL